MSILMMGKYLKARDTVLAKIVFSMDEMSNSLMLKVPGLDNSSTHDHE